MKNAPFFVEKPLGYTLITIMVLLVFFAYQAFFRPAESTTVKVNIAPEEMARIEDAARQVTAGIAEQRQLKASNEAVLADLQSLKQELDTKLATLEQRRREIEMDRELDRVELAGYKKLTKEVAVRELVVANIKRQEASLEQELKLRQDLMVAKVAEFLHPTPEEQLLLLIQDFVMFRDNRQWKALDTTVAQTANLIQHFPDLSDLRQHSYPEDLKRILAEKHEINFSYGFTDQNEYFGWLLEQFQSTTNQNMQGRVAEIMAGMFRNTEILQKYTEQLRSIRCPGNNAPLLEYLEYLSSKGKTAPIPDNISFTK